MGSKFAALIVLAALIVAPAFSQTDSSASDLADSVVTEEIRNNLIVIEEGDEFAWLVSFQSLVFIATLGMIVNFFTKKIQGESITAIRDYFRDHFKSTFVALVVTWLGAVTYYMTLSTGQTADMLVVFGMGFMFEDMLNKWSKPPGSAI